MSGRNSGLARWGGIKIGWSRSRSDHRLGYAVDVVPLNTGTFALAK
jgi:hypothetical protein